MDKRLTWEEIIMGFPHQWVGLSDIEYTEYGTVKTAVVKFHGLPFEDLIYKESINRSCRMFPTSGDIVEEFGFTI